MWAFRSCRNSPSSWRAREPLEDRAPSALGGLAELADALAAHAPPEGLSFELAPTTVRVAVWTCGVRGLGWPQSCQENDRRMDGVRRHDPHRGDG